jgi:hypothetical protein
VTGEARPAPGAPPRSKLPLFLVISALAATGFVIGFDYRLTAGQPGHGPPLGADFLVFWYASHLIWQGDFATLFDPWKFSAAIDAVTGGPDAFKPFPYPPVALWFVAPIAALPFAVALPLWQLATFTAFVQPLRRFFPSWASCVLILLTAPASLVNIADGQNGFLSAALLCGGLLLLERRPALAGLLFGLLTFKPQLGLLLPLVLIAGGYTRSFLVAAATAAGLVLASIALFGWVPWATYLTVGLGAQRQLLDIGTGPFMVMVPSFFMAGRLLELPLAVDYAVQGVVALGVVAACCWAIRRPIALERRAALVMVGTLLVSPYCFNYDMCILVAAQVIAWPGYRQRGTSEEGFQAAAWILPAAMIGIGLARLPIAPLILLAVFLFMLRRLRRAPQPLSADAR